jgi:hypothetical protein
MVLVVSTVGVAGVAGPDRVYMVEKFRDIISLTGEVPVAYPIRYDVFFASAWSLLLGGVITYFRIRAYGEMLYEVYRWVCGFGASIIGALLLFGVVSTLLPGDHATHALFTGVKILLVTSIAFPILLAVFECMHKSLYGRPANVSTPVGAGYSIFLTMVCMLYGVIVGLWYGILLWGICLFGFLCLMSTARGIGYLLYQVTHTGLFLRRTE